MGRLSEAVQAAPPFRRPLCSIAILRQRLSAEDRADLDALLLNESIPATIIAEKATALFEFELGQETVRRHRRRMLGRSGCSCQR